MTPRAETVHQRFLYAAELTKWVNGLAFLCEVASAGLAVYGIFSVKTMAWMPLLALGLAAGSVLIRTSASSVRGYAHRCRKISVRAFAFENDVDAMTLSNTSTNAPHFCDYFVGRGKGRTLEQYYEPTLPVGDERFREITAHSAFYTQSLLRTFSRLMLLVGAGMFLVAFLIVFDLAATAERTVSRVPILDALCSIVLGVFCVRSLETAFSAHQSSNAIRDVEGRLFTLPFATGQALQNLVDEYELERATSKDVPTGIYKWCRSRLQRQWHERRLTFTE